MVEISVAVSLVRDKDEAASARVKAVVASHGKPQSSAALNAPHQQFPNRINHPQANIGTRIRPVP